MHLECVPCSTYIYAMPICIHLYCSYPDGRLIILVALLRDALRIIDPLDTSIPFA